jgi:hypothetical protein
VFPIQVCRDAGWCLDRHYRFPYGNLSPAAQEADMLPATCMRHLSTAAVVVVSAAIAVHAVDAGYTGKIKRATPGRIVVATVADTSVTFRIGEQTEITISGKPAGPQDLKAGDFVRVSAAQSDGGMLIATRIAVSR